MRRLGWALLAMACVAVVVVLGVRAVLASDLVRSTLERQLADRVGQPVRIGEARAAVVPRIALDLHDVTIGQPPVVRLGTVRIVTGFRGLLARRVVDAEVIVSDSRMSLPLPFALLLASSRAAPDTPLDAPFIVESVRVLAFRDVTIVGGGQELTIDLHSSIDGDRLHVSSMAAQAETTRIEASGELTSIERLQGRFDARAAPLDVAEIIAIGSALSVPASDEARTADPQQPRALHIVVTLSAPAARFSTYDIRDVSMTLDIAPGRVAVSPLAVSLSGGTASGRLDVDTAARVPQLGFSGRLDAIDVEELMGRDGVPAGITGRLAGDASLIAAGTDPDGLMTAAHGTIRAALTDGTIPGMDMVRAIVLAFGRPAGAAPEGSGSTFSRLGGTFALADGTVISDNVAMESRDFDLAGRVALNLVTRELDASVDVVLSRELTAQAGTDLRRYAQEDGRIIVPARITGTLDRAIVSLDLAAVVKRAIGTELRRRTRSLLDDLFRRRDDP